MSLAVPGGGSGSDDKRPEERDESLPLPCLEQGNGQRAGVGEARGGGWWGGVNATS